MPNLKSAKKRLRQNEGRRLINSARKTRARKTRRSFDEALASGDVEASQNAYKAFCSAIDKAAKTGVVSKNNAIRNKSRAANALRALSSAS
jgi:small subunit ribosomal protein S20